MSSNVALVTGGSKGIGNHLCQKLADKGYKVGILDIAEKEGLFLCESLNKKYGSGSCIFCKCDVTDEDSIKKSFEAAIKEWGKIDLLVNNAGIWNDSSEGWKLSIDVNIKGVISGSLLAIKYMGKANGGLGGTVINIASILAFTVYSLMPIYSATKAAVLHFTRDMATKQMYELHGIKFIAMCPHGAMESELLVEPEKKLIDPGLVKAFVSIDFDIFQKAENVASGIIKCLEKGENGNVWMIEDESGARKIEIPTIEVMKF